MSSLKKVQIDSLLKLVENKQHKLIIMLLIDCGISVSKCVSLKINDFDFGNRSVMIGDRSFYISDYCYDLLIDFISSKNLVSDSYLFPGSSSGHLCRKSVNKFLERLAKKYPDFSGISPRSFQTVRIVSSSKNVHNNSFLGFIKNCFKSFQKHVDNHRYPEIQVKRVNSSSNSASSYGRSYVLKNINSLLSKGVSVMILGEVGVGKSHLIDRAVYEYKGKVLRLDDCYDIKKSLINILMFLYKGDKDAVKRRLYPDYDYDALVSHLQKDSIGSLCKEIIDALSGMSDSDNSVCGFKKEFLLVIDCCDKITPRGIKVLEDLKDHFCILSSARVMPLNKSSFLWNFEIIRLKNLERRFALGLIYYLSDGMHIEDHWLFCNHVYEQSSGNPRIIHELIDRYRREVVVSSDVVRRVRHSGGFKEFDCSIFAIVFLGVLSCLRFLSHELGNDSLRFLGGCSILFLMIFRGLFSKRKKL